MNWLGAYVATQVRNHDSVLDLGCGIMIPTNGRRLKECKVHVGVDCFKPYLDKIGQPSFLCDLPDGLEHFVDKSFDVVLMLDIIEHLEKPRALRLIEEAERIAKDRIILFTPDGPCPQVGWDAWQLGHNDAQAHRCEFTFDELVELGYKCRLHPNGTEQHGPITAVIGTKCVSRS